MPLELGHEISPPVTPLDNVALPSRPSTLSRNPATVLNDRIIAHIEYLQLPNGLDVYLVPMSNTPSVAIEECVGIGSRYEGPTMLGISHFLEHCVFLRTQNFADLNSIGEAMEAAGGRVNGVTTVERTVYHCRLPANRYETGLAILSDMLFLPAFEDSDIESKKSVVLAEMQTLQPLQYLQRYYASLLPEELVRPVIGTEATVKQFTVDEMGTRFLRMLFAAVLSHCHYE